MKHHEVNSFYNSDCSSSKSYESMSEGEEKMHYDALNNSHMITLKYIKCKEKYKEMLSKNEILKKKNEKLVLRLKLA